MYRREEAGEIQRTDLENKRAEIKSCFGSKSKARAQLQVYHLRADRLVGYSWSDWSYT